MRVLLVTHRFPPDQVAGVERYAQTLASELVRGGDAVSIATRAPGPSHSTPKTVRERTPDGALIYRFAGGQIPLDRFLLHHQQLERLFITALLEATPDVVHINHLIGLSPRFIQIAHRLACPVVLTLHDYYFACPLFQLRKRSGELCAGPDGGRECARTCFAGQQRSELRWGLRFAYFRRLLQSVDRIISPSRYVASYFEGFGADAERMRVVPNGVVINDELDCSSPVGRPRPLNLAYFGVVAAHKGVLSVLDALELAKVESINFTVFGLIHDRAYEQSLRERAASIGGLNFRMYGAYEADDLPHLLRDVDCVIVPSIWPENFPLVTQEALARGVPILASRLGGLPEIVLDGYNGFTFDPFEPDALALIVRRLTEDSTLLPRLREGARATPTLSLGAHAECVRAVYHEAMDAFLRTRPGRPSDHDELAFLHTTLCRLGVT